LAAPSLCTSLAMALGAPLDVLLYDLTSTYFECDPPQADDAKRRFGHSPDKRSDCVQAIIALVVTPEGLPLAYEVLAGNTADNTTLRNFLDRIEGQYGRARRLWAMDRGIQTEAVLKEMREVDPPVHYLEGTAESVRETVPDNAAAQMPSAAREKARPRAIVARSRDPGERGEGEPGLGRHRAPPGRSCLLVTKVSRKLYENCTDIPRRVSGTFSYLLICF
jgi:hypothetical protein